MIKRTLVILLFVQAACLWGQNVPESRVIDSLLNPEFEYSMPLESPDGKRLYYLRTAISASMKQKGLGQEIWYSEKVDGKWGKPQHLFHFLPDQGNNALVGISTDQKTFYVFNSQTSHRTLARGIAKTSQDSLGEWKDFELLDIPGLKIDEGIFSFYVHPDGELVLISMPNKDKESADNDLYFSQRAQNGIWSPVKLLGNIINTDGFEGTPFLSADFRTLYFASNGHEGAKKTDIYKSERLDESWEKWSKPERLPAPYNSPDFDAYFSLVKEKAYWVSNRQHENSQVYFSQIVLKTTIQLGELDSPKQKIEGKNTVAIYNKIEEEVAENKVEVDNSEEDQKLRIYFDYNHFELTQAHKKQLQEFIANWASEVKINLSGYADNVGSAKNNLKVSRLRAQAVYNYLIELSVPSKQIVLNSYGDKSRFGNNVSEEGRAKNRVVILE